MKESLGDITGKKTKPIARTQSAKDIKKKGVPTGRATPTPRKKK